MRGTGCRIASLLSRLNQACLLSLAIAMIMPFAPTVAHSSSLFLLRDDFEAHPSGSPPPGWLQGPLSGPFLVTDHPERNSLRCLALPPAPPKATLSRSFPPQRSPLVFQFYVYLPLDSSLSFGLSLGPPSLPASRAIQATFQKDRSIVFFNGEANERITTFRGNRWMKLALVADPSIAAFHLYIDGIRKTASPLPFWNVVDKLDTVYFETTGEGPRPELAEGAGCLLDNIIVDTSPAPPAPTGLHISSLRPDEIVLRWLPARQSGLTGYRLYRAGKLLAELPPSLASFTDKGLLPCTGYAYSLTALASPLPRQESLPTWPVAARTPTPSSLRFGSTNKYDVVIYGATPAGIAAALAAARLSSSVALVEPTADFGGMMTGGLGRTDVRNRALQAGIFREFIQNVKSFYLSAYGPQSRQVGHSSSGYYFEPAVARAVFLQMLSDQPGIETYFLHSLSAVRTRHFSLTSAQPSSQTSLLSMTIEDIPSGKTKTLFADAFIDASYEADLAALAGTPYRVGREGRDEFNEEHAGEIFWDYKKYVVAPGGSGKGDNRVQAYNYRLCLTKRPGNKTPIRKPKGYDPATYATVLLDAQERFLRLSEILSLGRIPNDKFDVNNHGFARQSTDLPEANYDYPDADPQARAGTALLIKDYILGLLYFLQNDPRLPAYLRSEAAQWGLAKDEFTDTGGFPSQLYVREARRIVGLYTLAEKDALLDPALGRTTPQPDSIAVGDYPMDSHATQKWHPERPDAYEGFFYLPYITKPYQIPYRVMLPLSVQRLLVAAGVSATHVGYGSLRMEPVMMALGQAAGTAAYLASQAHTWPKNVPIPLLQQILLQTSQVLDF